MHTIVVKIIETTHDERNIRDKFRPALHKINWNKKRQNKIVRIFLFLKKKGTKKIDKIIGLIKLIELSDWVCGNEDGIKFFKIKISVPKDKLRIRKKCWRMGGNGIVCLPTVHISKLSFSK